MCSFNNRYSLLPVFIILMLVLISSFLNSLVPAKKTKDIPPSCVRRSQTEYIVAREKGTARHLFERCLLIHIFVSSKDTLDWSAEGKVRVASAVESAKNWIKKQALQYNINNLEFADDVIFVDRYLPVARLITPNFGSQEYNDFLKEWSSLLIYAMGYKSWNAFIKEKEEQFNADNSCVFFHINCKGRSYAISQIQRFSGILSGRMPGRNIEYSFVFAVNKHGYILWQEPVYAHEMFHMFGADDLYDIKGAENYYVYDIMNLMRMDIDNNMVSPLTAYAVSWTGRRPVIEDFKVVEKY